MNEHDTSEKAQDSPPAQPPAAEKDTSFYEDVKARLRRVADKICARRFVQKATKKTKAAIDWLPQGVFPAALADRLPGRKTGKAALKFAVALWFPLGLCAISRFWCLVGMAVSALCIYYALVAIRRNPYQTRGVFFAMLALYMGFAGWLGFKARRVEIARRQERDEVDSFASAYKAFGEGMEQFDRSVDELGEAIDNVEAVGRAAGAAAESAWNEFKNAAQREYDDLDADTKREINEAAREFSKLFN